VEGQRTLFRSQRLTQERVLQSPSGQLETAMRNGSTLVIVLSILALVIFMVWVTHH
jgi:hypothetical protein